MKTLHLLHFTVLTFIFSSATSQVESYLNKAERCIEDGNLREAKDNYQKALAASPENRKANLGLGLLYCDLLDDYARALPYLETAYRITVRDSSYDLLFALGKCYHYSEYYPKAISFYDRLKGVEDLEKEKDFQKEVNKRKADCEYAITNGEILPTKNIYIVNCGKTINTDMPEYVPVLTGHNELIFTSKRKDIKKEELNYLDGKYFESMYIAGIETNGFKNLRRYTLPDKYLDSKFYKHHQSVVSLSQDGKKLFTFKDSKLYEIDLDERKINDPGEIKIKSFTGYQNHAFLTRDGKTLYFTSDAPGGLGGNDIYRSSRTDKGEWSTAINLGPPVNTSFNEDAPFLASDGTLYFASEGHEGFGNYDIYKSSPSDGAWLKPQNLGRPINSAGHDIFLVLDSAKSVGYFSSGRNGGYGDMDIYKIIDLDKINKDCPPLPSDLFSYQVRDADTSDFKNRIEITIPPNFKILSCEWMVAEMASVSNSPVFEHNYGKTGLFKVQSKLIAWCDTCLSPLVACKTIENKIEKMIPEVIVHEETHTPTVSASTPAAPATIDNTGEVEGFKGVLTGAQLASIGFNSNHLLFDFNKSTLRSDALEILNTNCSVLKKYPQLHLQVSGYTDSRGSDAVNKKVSAQRAKAVKDYLLKKGISAIRINFINAEGSSKLVNNCGAGVECSEEQHQKNRRVEFVVLSNN